MTKDINDVIDFAHHKVEVEHDIVPQEKVVKGIASDANTKITMQTYNHYTDPTERFFAGIWASSVGAKSVCYTEEEVCVILEGRVRLTDLQGNAKEFVQAARLFYRRVQRYLGNLRSSEKIYVIWQAK